MLSAAGILLILILAYPKVKPLFSTIMTEEAEEIVEAFPVDVVIARETVLDDKISATGNIRANQEVSLSAEVSGKITGLFIEEGAEVERGKLLVKINDNDLQAQLRQVEYSLEVMKETEQRQQQLFERGGATQEDYEATLIRLNSLRSEKDYIEAGIERTEIRAPFDGRLGLKYVSSGSYITPGTRIATLQDVSSVKIDFSVPERYSSRITPGSKILFTVQGVDSVFTGEVYASEPHIDTRTRTLQVRARSDNKDGLLRPGAFAGIEFILDSHENAVMIPSIALIPDMGNYSVFLYRDGRVVEQPVKTGIRTRNKVQVYEGLSAQDTVLVNGLLQVREGSPVSIREVRILDL